jgi:mannonate dehydratase
MLVYQNGAFRPGTRNGAVSMQMALRWFGPGFDPVSLEHIRQIPGVSGVVTTLHDMTPGAVWPVERIRALKMAIERAGLRVLGIESVNVPDSIKAGLPGRDRDIDAYVETLSRLGREGIRLVCYNFMPVFDWTRTSLAKIREDGATVFAYDRQLIDSIDPLSMFDRLDSGSNGYLLPGWEPERMRTIRELFEVYEHIDTEALFRNLEYFLTAIMPVCETYGITMALHPDDPAWPVFGLPRIAVNGENLERIVRMVDSPWNAIALCSGSLGTNPSNDIPAIIRSLSGKIAFAHVRNIRQIAPGSFEEAAHLSSDGSLDMYEIMRALHETGFDGVMRPDHGRGIWGEVSIPGYGLYDRAIGASYLLGLWEALSKTSPKASAPARGTAVPQPG